MIAVISRRTWPEAAPGIVSIWEPERLAGGSGCARRELSTQVNFFSSINSTKTARRKRQSLPKVRPHEKHRTNSYHG